MESGSIKFGGFTGFGHQFNKESKNFTACKSSLEEAYAAIMETGSDRLKSVINEAIELAALESIIAQDNYNSHA